MKKTLIFAMLGLALTLTLASPTQAHARVVVGVAVGPVVPHPVYHAYVYPRPYYRWGYGPAYPVHYWGPYWRLRTYGYRVYAGPRYHVFVRR